VSDHPFALTESAILFSSHSDACSTTLEAMVSTTYPCSISPSAISWLDQRSISGPAVETKIAREEEFLSCLAMMEPVDNETV
jgi:hypothetical protein